MSEKQKVHANVKDEKLIQLRREQIVKGAISLFKEKGFHRTTTREIAKLAGFSIGSRGHENLQAVGLQAFHQCPADPDPPARAVQGAQQIRGRC